MQMNRCTNAETADMQAVLGLKRDIFYHLSIRILHI